MILLLLALQDVDGLILKLRSEDSAVRDAATAELRAEGPKAEPALRRAAGDPDAEVAARAAHLLRIIDIVRNIPDELVLEYPGLPDRLTAGDDASWTSTFLHVHAAPSFLNFLFPCALAGARSNEELRDVLRAATTRRLSSGNFETIAHLSHPSESVRSEAAAYLCIPGRRHTDPRLVTLLASDDPGIRECARDVVVHAGHRDLVPKIADLLGDERAEIRVEILQVLGEMKAFTAAPRIAGLLEDHVAPVRATSLHALRKIGARAWHSAIPRLLDDPDPSIRSEALKAAGERDLRTVVPRVIELLSDGDGDVQEAACRALEKLNMSGAAPSMIPLLRIPAVQSTAYSALRTLARPEHAAGIAKLLKDPEFDVRALACSLLGFSGASEAAPRLLDRLADSNALVRRFAAAALGDLRIEEAAGPLARALDDADERVRHAAAAALSGLKAPEALAAVLKRADRHPEVASEIVNFPPSKARDSAILQLLKNRDPRLREVVVNLIRYTTATEPLRELLDATYLDFRAFVAGRLAELGDPEALPVLADLMRLMPHLDARKRCAEAIASFGDPSSFDHPDIMVRGAALRRLGTLRSPNAIPTIARALDDAAPEVRGTAVALLFEMNAVETAPAILNLMDDESAVVRNRVIRATAKFRPPGAPEALERCAATGKSSETPLRAQAEMGEPGPFVSLLAAAIGPDDPRLPPIRTWLLDGGPFPSAAIGSLLDEQRASVLDFLAARNDRESAPLIVERLDGMDPSPAFHALQLMGKWKIKAAATAAGRLFRNHPAWRTGTVLVELDARDQVPMLLEVLRTEGDDGSEALQALHGLRAREAIPALVAMLEDPEPLRRQKAAYGLGELRACESEPRLIRLLSDPDAEVVGAALIALQLCGGDAAVRASVPLLNDPDAEIVIAALGTMQIIPSREGIPSLLGLLESDDSDLKYIAARALARIGDDRCLGVLRAWARDPWNGGGPPEGLCRLGMREGVEDLLQSRHSRFPLNRLRSPEAWRRLGEGRLTEDLDGTVAERFERIARAAGLKLEIRVVPPDGRHWTSARGGQTRLLDALDDTEDLPYTAILEPDRIRVVSEAEAEAFWREWWRKSK